MSKRLANVSRWRPLTFITMYYAHITYTPLVPAGVTGAVSRRAVRASARRRRSGVEPLFSLLPFILFRYAAHCILFSRCSLHNG